MAQVCLECWSAAATHWAASTPLPEPMNAAGSNGDAAAPDAATLQMQRLDLR